MKYPFIVLILIVLLTSGCTQSYVQDQDEVKQIIEAAIATKTVQKCEEIKEIANPYGGLDRNSCYSQYAKNHLELAVCNKITIESSIPSRAQCKIDIARSTENPEICNTITEEDIANYPLANRSVQAKNLCFANVAIDSKKLSVCDMYLPDPDSDIPIKEAKEKCKAFIKESCESHLNSTATDEASQSIREKCVENYLGST